MYRQNLSKVAYGATQENLLLQTPKHLELQYHNPNLPLSETTDLISISVSMCCFPCVFVLLETQQSMGREARLTP